MNSLQRSFDELTTQRCELLYNPKLNLNHSARENLHYRDIGIR